MLSLLTRMGWTINLQDGTVWIRNLQDSADYGKVKGPDMIYQIHTEGNRIEESKLRGRTGYIRSIQKGT